MCMREVVACAWDHYILGLGEGSGLRACWKPLFAQLQHKYCCACCHDSMLIYRNIHSRALAVRSKFRLYILGHESGRAC